MYIALGQKTLLSFLKIAVEDRRTDPWQNVEKRKQCWSFSV